MTKDSRTRQWHLLLITDMPVLRDSISDYLVGINVSLDVINLDEARAEVFRTTPDLILLHEPKEGMGPETVGFLLEESPTSSVIYLAETRDFVMMREALRAGASDVLIVPDEEAMLGDVVRRALRSKQENDLLQKQAETTIAPTPFNRGKILAVYSAKGGSGKTLLASTLSQTLQLDFPYNVLLVDLSFQFGGVEAVMGLKGDRSLYDLLPVIDELNETYLRNVTVRIPTSQLDVLLSPVNAEKGEQIRPEHIQRLLRVARRYYDYIVVDLPSFMDENNLMALRESDRILYTLTPEVPALKAFRHALDLFRKLSVDTSSEHLGVIYNRVHRRNEVSIKDLEKLDEIHSIGRLKEDLKHIQNSYNTGTPIRQTPKDRRIGPYARQVRKIAKDLIRVVPVKEDQETEGGPEKKDKVG